MEILPAPDILLDPPELPEISLPKGWTEYTLLAVLHVIALARIIVLNVANWPADRKYDGLRFRTENDRLKGEVDLLQQEIDIKDARFSRIDPKKRPAYNALERFEILALKAIRGWSKEQVAKRFHLTVQTVINWIHGIDRGDGSKVAMPEKTNRYRGNTVVFRLVQRTSSAQVERLARNPRMTTARAAGKGWEMPCLDRGSGT